ncbi:nitroreductase family protein [Winogradskyella pacifica]|uniref:Nitroreductase n=1 Tax=Winogradskyella pacifica TaxID=664642 RepID=A0A3D9LMN1_9FLAO|nr:nitroreductase family protein [Winogradskyella pacifica]REE08472.1 nitroreductase [Winogradskyella pacifica]
MKFFIKKIFKENKKSKIYQISSWVYKRYFPYVNVVTNMFSDTFFYCKHSNVFKVNTLNKIEAKIILDYHSIEKGLLFSQTKYGFAKDKIKRLNKYLKNQKVLTNSNKSQISVAYSVMCEYYELHKKNNFDISSFYAEDDYLFYKNHLNSAYNNTFSGVIEYTKNDFFDHTFSSFDKFSDSRKSVRNFTGNLIDDSTIEKAIMLSKNAPSVCNRQPSKAYYLKDKSKIDKVLELQAGLNGFTQNINQLLIITTDVNYYYSIGERYQFYIDGGVYLMNLLYSLHFYNIAACPANWAKEKDDEKRIKQILDINSSEKVICLIAIGEADENFKTTLSKRRDLDEVLTIIK